MPREILDNLERIQRIDRSGMARLITGLPEQIAKSIAIVNEIEWPAWTTADFDSIAVLGMGGSAIGGDLVRSYLVDTLPVPMAVIRNYDVPRFVSDKTLIFASSYSGDTEETLSAVGQPQTRGCRTVVLCTGGQLERRAMEQGWPLVTLPGGFPPRAALGYSFTTLYLALAKFGFTGDPTLTLRKLSEFLSDGNEKFQPAVSFEKNEAKRLAAKIHGRIPVVYGAVGAMAVAALRWKGQICENAENLAFAGEAPEFNHNEIVGWGLPEGSADKLFAVVLQSPADHPRITRRFEIARSLLEKKSIPVETVTATGDDPLQHLFSLVQYGDWVSFYLAILNGVDPTPIAAIDYFKGKLDDVDK